MDAGKPTPPSGENVSDESAVQTDSATRLFSMYRDVFEERMVQARRKTEEGDLPGARGELKAIRSDVAMLLEVLNDE